MSRAQAKAIADAFGKAVREKRHALHLTQEELAARCRLHRTYVAGVERGKRNPSLVSIVRITSGLGIQPSELLSAMEAHLKR